MSSCPKWGPDNDVRNIVALKTSRIMFWDILTLGFDLPSNLSATPTIMESGEIIKKKNRGLVSRF